MAKPHKIALMRPLLVGHENAIKYLKEIDKNRWYSNFGPLVQLLEERLAEFFGTGKGSVVTVSNGTAGLVNILRAMNLPKGTFCLLPSWTFIATPASVIAAGLTPYFIDVDEATWTISPQNAKKIAAQLNGQVSAVMVVSPFGAPINTEAWDKFTDETGIPAIIDAAAGFDAFSSMDWSKPSATPVMVSMHATKTFGAGEGGAVISTNTKLITRVRQMSNFGFTDSREISVPGTNAKMSEYTAAFALSTLDLWPQTREIWLCRKWWYAQAFAKIAKPVGVNPWMNEEWASSTFSIRLHKPYADEVIKQLNEEGIESKQWWIKGCHRQPAYASFPHTPLPVTEMLGQTVLGVPFTLDIEEQDVARIMQTLQEITESLTSAPRAKSQ